MPLGVSLGLDEWDEGNRNLRLITHNGLHLPELRLDHRLTMTTSLAADGTETQRSAGRLRLGFDLFGGQQEGVVDRSEEHTSELQSLMRISYAVFCLTKKK